MSDRKSNPRVRLRSAAETSGYSGGREPLDAQAWKRGFVAAFVVLNPLLSLCAYALTHILARLRRVRMRWVVLGSVGVLLVLLLVGAVRAYTRVYVDLLHALTDVEHLHGFKDRLGSLVSSMWPTWFWGQFPVALVGGLVIASVIAWRRERYRADWREETTRKPIDRQKVEKQTRKMDPIVRDQKPQSLDAVRINLGIDEKTLKPLPMTIGNLRYHAFIPGPSGSGKSTTLRQLIRSVSEGEPVRPYRIGTTYINLKPDPELTAYLQDLAARTGRRFHRITQNGIGSTTTYNPLRHGTVSEKRDLLIYAEANAEGGGFSEAHYYAVSTRFTLLALRALEVLVNNGATYTRAGQSHPWQMDMEHLVKAMRMSVLTEVANTGGDPALSERLGSYFAEIKEDPDTARGVGGIRNRFANVIEGSAEPVLVSDEGGLDLSEAIRGGDIVLFDLDAAVDQIASQYIANLAIADYRATMARLAEAGWHGDSGNPKRLNLLVVDEFGALGGTGLTSLLERGRAWGACVVLTLQAYTAMADKFGEGFRSDVMTNTSLKILHQQDDAADELASYIGTDTVWKETLQTYENRDLMGSQSEASGQGTLREAEQFSFHPNEFKNLAVGEAIVLMRMPRRAAKVKIYRASTPVRAMKELEATPAPAEPENAPDQDRPAEPTPETPVNKWAAAAQRPASRPTEPVWDEADDDDMPPIHE